MPATLPHAVLEGCSNGHSSSGFPLSTECDPASRSDEYNGKDRDD
jgi:hypothetical protein